MTNFNWASVTPYWSFEYREYPGFVTVWDGLWFNGNPLVYTNGTACALDLYGNIIPFGAPYTGTPSGCWRYVPVEIYNQIMAPVTTQNLFSVPMSRVEFNESCADEMIPLAAHIDENGAVIVEKTVADIPKCDENYDTSAKNSSVSPTSLNEEIGKRFGTKMITNHARGNLANDVNNKRTIISLLNPMYNGRRIDFNDDPFKDIVQWINSGVAYKWYLDATMLLDISNPVYAKRYYEILGIIVRYCTIYNINMATPYVQASRVINRGGDIL